MDQDTLKQLEEMINNALVNVATKHDIDKTKAELSEKIHDVKLTIDKTRSDLIEEIKEVEVSITVSAERGKAEKTELDDLEKRVDKLERKVFV